MIEKIYQFWGIKPEHVVDNEFTGYESLYREFDKFSNEVYNQNPTKVIDEVFDLYRSVNLVPITYYTEHGLKDAIENLRKSKYLSVKDNVISLGNNKGQAINRFIFTNMMNAEVKKVARNSLRDRFYNDTKLKRAIRLCFELRQRNRLIYPIDIRNALDLVTGGNITNFKAQNARTIAEYLCPKLWGNIYDYSAGYGGRLLGISISKLNYNYIGIDPNTETFEYLGYLSSLLGNRATVIQATSQDYEPENIDLAFSSPPYFNLEKYSNEPTQCMVQFKTLDEWFEGYVVPTIRNIYKGLNNDGIFAANIADYYAEYKSNRKTEFKIVDPWIEISEKLGFEHCKTIKMKINARPGSGNAKEKFEGVYVFTK